jgi:HPt (histidine-containing phosphotransfer) domain-containing protein
MSGKAVSLDQAVGSPAVAGAFASRTDERVQPIDLESLMRRCLDDHGFCAMILHKFAARSEDQLAALERALDSANAPELARQAHTLQGVAANLSAHGLRAAAEELEAAAGRSDFAAAEPALKRTRAELVRCVAAIPAMIERVVPRD